jgi:ketosteroid isomerase-like protein
VREDRRVTTSQQQVAEAFSAHRFGEVVGHLAEDVRWVSPGGPTVEGRGAVEAAFASTTAQLEGVTTEFPRFLTIVGTDAVVVDAVARYTGPDGTFAVSSCDVYEFAGEALARITSYVVEV